MKIHHFDSSVVIPCIGKLLDAPLRKQEDEKMRTQAAAFFKAHRGPVKISVATYAEVIRHFPGDEKVKNWLGEKFPAPMQITQKNARRWARIQNRSKRVMGDNDAWNAAIAIDDNAVLVGCDHTFENRPGLDYLDFTK